MWTHPERFYFGYIPDSPTSPSLPKHLTEKYNITEKEALVCEIAIKHLDDCSKNTVLSIRDAIKEFQVPVVRKALISDQKEEFLRYVLSKRSSPKFGTSPKIREERRVFDQQSPNSPSSKKSVSRKAKVVKGRRKI